jgi:phage portal protein BeeE
MPDQVRELYALRPDRMKLVPGPDGWPEAYDYTVAGSTVRFPQNTALPPILHLTLFNPLDDHYGLSPLDADRIEALSADRAALWDRVSKAPFLSVNEKRLATGYGAVDGGDVLG